jgi:hypothetical protein
MSPKDKDNSPSDAGVDVNLNIAPLGAAIQANSKEQTKRGIADTPPKTTNVLNEGLHTPRHRLDRILRAEVEIENETDEHNKRAIAWGTENDLHALLKCFKSVIAYTGPSAFGADGALADFEQIRQGVSKSLVGGLPISEIHSTGLGRALLALNEGEVHDFVTPTITGQRDYSWSISRIEFLLCVHVWIFRARGRTALSARSEVAELCGYGDTGHETIRKLEAKSRISKTYSEGFKIFWRENAAALGAGKYPNDGDENAIEEWYSSNTSEGWTPGDPFPSKESFKLQYLSSLLKQPWTEDGYLSPIAYAVDLYQRALR